MGKLIRKIMNKGNDDRGDSELISLIILLPLVVAILFTMIDVSAYFSNRAQIQSVARDGARTVAIMGGNGTGTLGTPIENQYGVSKDTACDGLSTSPASNPVTAGAFHGDLTVTECTVLKTYDESAGLVNTKINRVVCSPSKTVAIGSKVSCTVEWSYNHIPGSSLAFIKFGNDNTSVGHAESEVNLTGIPLQ